MCVNVDVNLRHMHMLRHVLGWGWVGCVNVDVNLQLQLQVQPCWNNNSIIQFRVPVSLALSLCQYVVRRRHGLGQTEPRSASIAGFRNTGPLSQENRRKIVMTKTSRCKELVFGVRFWT